MFLESKQYSFRDSGKSSPISMIRNKISTFQLLSCQIVGKVLHYGFPAISEGTRLSHSLIVGKLV
jgi:hypothetical protein